MGSSNDLRNGPHAPTQPNGCGKRGPKLPALVEEAMWRVLPSGCVTSAPESQVLAARWQSLEATTKDAEAETSADLHVVKIVLRSMNIRLAVAGSTVLDGVSTPGTFHVTPPVARVRATFHGAYDVLHLFVPNSLIVECNRDMPRCRRELLWPGAEPSRDPILEWLGRSLLEANKLDGYSERMYVDSLSLAIVVRLRAVARATVSGAQSKVRALPRWRLKQAIDYVESRLAESISLAEIASATGITRMHFAAQFRAATGLRPHEYLLRRRIERSQEMLLSTDMT